MKFFIITLLIGFIGFVTNSCESKKLKSNPTSQFLTDSIYSKHLEEYRKHNIYLPKEFNRDKKYPIIYATDGNSNVTGKKNVLDSLIHNRIIKPLIFIASFSNNKVADSTGSKKFGDGKKYTLTYRYFEYVKESFTEDVIYPQLEKRFENHMQYFAEELIPTMEAKYNQNLKKNDRYFYGISNGAGFGLSLLNKNPTIIGTYICFSNFGSDVQSNTWISSIHYPNLYLRYGSDEPSFLKEDANFLKSKYAESNSLIEIEEYDGGHNNKFWKEEFIEVISKVLKSE